MFLEDNLELSIRELLPLMQHQITTGSRYFGIPTMKCPLDAWVYQEILFENRPDVIVEIGNFCGGSALYLAHLCDLLGSGRVICVDKDHHNLHQAARDHPRITFITGRAGSQIGAVRAALSDLETVMVIEDSSHTYENTLEVLRIYSSLVSIGQYFIVEDSIVNHGLDRSGKWPQGPFEAVETFLQENAYFVADRDREKFFITWNPKGYLRRSA
jgi:cephalosporin hydroxylase